MNNAIVTAVDFARTQMQPMTVSAIVAVDENGGIGFKGGLPWPRLKEDMQFFRGVTTDSVVIMGRKTYESLPSGPLPNRINFVISRSVPFEKIGQDVEHENLYWYRSLEEAIGSAFCFHGNKKAIIVGGGKLYRQALVCGIVQTLIVSAVSGKYKSDVAVNLRDIEDRYLPLYTNITDADDGSIETESSITIRTEDPSVSVTVYSRRLLV